MFTIIVIFFEERGFQIISSNEIYPNQTLDHEVITKQSPSTSDLEDIVIGIKLLKHLSTFDIGQSVIIGDRCVLSIEVAEGTDNLITRCALLRKRTIGEVLIRMMKLNQDNRMDIPTIVPDTILNTTKHNYNGIAIEENSVIILNPELIINLVHQHNIFVIRNKC